MTPLWQDITMLAAQALVAAGVWLLIDALTEPLAIVVGVR